MMHKPELPAESGGLEGLALRWCSRGQCVGKSGVPSPPDDSPDPPHSIPCVRPA